MKMPKMLRTLGFLARAALAFGVATLLALPFGSPALAGSDGDTYDIADTFEQFERMDAAEFNDLIEQAKTCIKNWDFACAKAKLEKARLSITRKGDNAIITSLKKYMAFEILLARSHQCAKNWNFDCAIEKLKEAERFAGRNRDSFDIQFHALLERLEAAASYIEKQYNLREENAKQNPEIVVVDTYKVSRGQVVRAEVWAAGKKVMSPEILIEWYNPSIGGYEIALYDSGPFAKLLCSLYVFGSGYYTNELRCAGDKVGETRGYERLNYPLERLVKDIVMFFYRRRH